MFSQYLSIAAALCGAFSGVPSPVSAADKPDPVVFLSDDHTWRDSSVYGSPDINTPNMQRLANAGMTFNQALVASPNHVDTPVSKTWRARYMAAIKKMDQDLGIIHTVIAFHRILRTEN